MMKNHKGIFVMELNKMSVICTVEHSLCRFFHILLNGHSLHLVNKVREK